MKHHIHYKVFIFLILVLFINGTGAQTFFKVHEASGQFFNQKITRFTGGDLLIGDSSLESLSNGGFDGKVFLTRMDPCGNIVWSYSYLLAEGHLFLKDLKVNEAEDVFVYGSFYRGLEELIFLLKVNGRDGDSGDYKLFDPGSVDHFTFSMDLRDGQLMIYGLLLDFNTQKEGFIARFNSNLNFLWGRIFTPFESSGAAIITADNGFVGRSGEFLIKMNEAGDPEWATVLDAGPNTHPVGGPLEVDGGFLLEAHRQGLSFFYKVGPGGQLLWQTEMFSSTDHGAAMSLLAEGNVLCTYNNPEGQTTRLCQLEVTPDGALVKQRRLIAGHTFNTGSVYQSVHTDDLITIAGNASPVASQSADIADFILQFSLDTLPESCMSWENFRETFANNVNTAFSFYDPGPVPFNMVLEESIRTDTATFILPLGELCRSIPEPAFLQKDTLLPCAESWIVPLPAPGFIWVDGAHADPRVIDLPGTYRARKRSCSNPFVVEYTLEKESCGCRVYFPNAFSPNDDGINDRLQIFSDCALDEMEMTVFDRWGSRVFYSNDLGFLWDGARQQQDLPSGVYVVMLTYRWTDFDGKLQQGNAVQDVTLLR